MDELKKNHSYRITCNSISILFVLTAILSFSVWPTRIEVYYFYFKEFRKQELYALIKNLSDHVEFKEQEHMLCMTEA